MFTADLRYYGLHFSHLAQFCPKKAEFTPIKCIFGENFDFSGPNQAGQEKRVSFSESPLWIYEKLFNC